MKNRTQKFADSGVELSVGQLARATGGAMDFNKLFPTLNAAANAVADLQGELDGGPYHPGGAPPDRGSIIR